ncbi:hypothetical protein V5O48_011375, partial [Marasmius crinis-equi]
MSTSEITDAFEQPISGSVGIFWDYENCGVPTHMLGYSLVNRISEIGRRYGCIKSFKSYADLSQWGNSRCPILQSSGVTLDYCPNTGRKGKEIVDKKIISAHALAYFFFKKRNGRISADMMAFAMDHPALSTTIILISGDRDYSYTLSTLRDRQMRTVLISSGNTSHISLTSQPTMTLDWNLDILNDLKEERSRLDSEASGLSGPEAYDEDEKPLNLSRRKRTVSFEQQKPRSRPSSRRSNNASLPAGDDEVGVEAVEAVASTSSTTINASSKLSTTTPKEISPPSSPFQSPQPAATNPDGPEVEPTRAVFPSSAPSPLSGSSRHFSNFPAAFRNNRTPANASASSSSRQRAPARRQPLDDPTIPAHFKSLMTILQKHHQEGADRPLRTTISHELKIQDSKVFKKVVISEFGEYAS